MRFWFSGPRILGGLVRPGISFSGRELAALGRKVPKRGSDGVLGIVRRPDGALALAVPDANPSGVETASVEGILYAITFGRRDDALEARAGVLVRLGRHVGGDGWLFGLSVGEVLAVCNAEIGALGLDAKTFRIRKPESLPPVRQSGVLRPWLAVAGCMAIAAGLAALIVLMIWFWS